jgi:hypothetical protein
MDIAHRLRIEHSWGRVSYDSHDERAALYNEQTTSPTYLKKHSTVREPDSWRYLHSDTASGSDMVEGKKEERKKKNEGR